MEEYSDHLLKRAGSKESQHMFILIPIIIIIIIIIIILFILVLDNKFYENVNERGGVQSEIILPIFINIF